MELQTVKKQLKNRLSLGLNFGLKSLEELISSSSILRNELINYKSQYNDLNRIASQNLIGYEQIELGFNKIRMGLLNLIDQLSSTDLVQEKSLPKLQNNELQFRKNNFFQLLNLHLSNVEAFFTKMQLQGSGPLYNKEIVKTGRDGFHSFYKEYFRYGFKNPPREDIEKYKNNIKLYSKDFFTTYMHGEVYFNMLKFMLKYTLEEEMEQDFFLGVIKANLSIDELRIIFYYIVSGIDPEFKEVAIEANLFGDNFAKNLYAEEDFLLLK